MGSGNATLPRNLSLLLCGHPLCRLHKPVVSGSRGLREWHGDGAPWVAWMDGAACLLLSAGYTEMYRNRNSQYCHQQCRGSLWKQHPPVLHPQGKTQQILPLFCRCLGLAVNLFHILSRLFLNGCFFTRSWSKCLCVWMFKTQIFVPYNPMFLLNINLVNFQSQAFWMLFSLKQAPRFGVLSMGYKHLASQGEAPTMYEIDRYIIHTYIYILSFLGYYDACVFLAKSMSLPFLPISSWLFQLLLWSTRSSAIFSGLF